MRDLRYRLINTLDRMTWEIVERINFGEIRFTDSKRVMRMLVRLKHMAERMET